MKKILIKTTIFFLALYCILISINANAQYIDKKKYLDNKPIIFAQGFINFSLANQQQANGYDEKTLGDSTSKNRINASNFNLGNDSQIFIKSGIKNNFNQKFGAIAKIEFNFSNQNLKENPNIDQAFLFAENDYGNFEFGNNQAVNQKMKYGPARFARGSGGINGKYLQYVNLPMLNNSNCESFSNQPCANIKLPRFITLAQSPIGHGGYAKSFYRRGVDNNFSRNQRDYNAYSRSNFRAFKDDSYDGIEDSTKISYYSPKINGLQFGLSYGLNSADNGVTANVSSDVDYLRLKNIFAIGVNYVEDFDNLSLAISSTAEKAKVDNSNAIYSAPRHDLFSYDFGVAMSYFGFKFGASYGNWGKSLQAKNGIYSCQYQLNFNLSSQDCTTNIKRFRNPYYYTLGLAYQFSSISASISSLNSNFQNNRYQAISFGLDYKYSKNLLPYFEYTKFAFKVNQPQANNLNDQASLDNNYSSIKNNLGHIFLIGILYSF